MRLKRTKPRFLVPRAGSALYLIVIVVSLVFTQALRSTASAILFVFLLLLPIVSLLYIIIARAVIKVYTDSDVTRAGKGDPVEYEIKIINESPLPFPFVETIVSLPSDDAVVCRDELMRITLLPMGCHLIKSRVHFPLRGSYDIGVKYLYIGDLFGLFRTELKLELHRTIIVYPRRISMSENSARSDTDIPTSSTRRTSSPDQAEQSDIRNYIPGDNIKSIHWKLSSKSEELQVKNWAANTDRHTYILLDLSFCGESEDRDNSYPRDHASRIRHGNRKKSGRRQKTSESTGVAMAKSVGKAGGTDEGTRGSSLRSTEERLAALGVTAEAIAAVSASETEAEPNIEDGATRKGAKNARRITAERMAKLAMSIEKSSKNSGEIKTSNPYDPDKLMHAGEICADSVIELALSSMRSEVRRGAFCTVLYPDPRNDGGIGVLTSDNDASESAALLELFTVPVCRNSQFFPELAMLIDQSSGITLQIVTANTDMYSAALFSSVTDSLGGAGSGCSAEVLLAKPGELWKSESARASASRAMADELAKSGIGLRQFVCEPGTDGSPAFTSGD